jgi:multiple sugar transport system substrate-binding protein
MERQGVTRRQFIKSTSAGALGLATWMALSTRAGAQEPTLRIVQWNHFVPAYDEWFNKVFAPRWGQKNGVKVVVENVSYAELPAIGASEASRVAAGQDPGHDLVQFNNSTARRPLSSPRLLIMPRLCKRYSKRSASIFHSLMPVHGIQ